MCTAPYAQQRKPTSPEPRWHQRCDHLPDVRIASDFDRRGISCTGPLRTHAAHHVAQRNNFETHTAAVIVGIDVDGKRCTVRTLTAQAVALDSALT